VPAPVRFLPEYDNVLLSHADRSRFTANEVAIGRAIGPYKGAVLVDGTVGAIWHSEIDRAKRRATVVVDHVPFPASVVDAIEAEALDMAAFWHASADRREMQMRPIEIP
jgi:hypothetical protein